MDRVRLLMFLAFLGCGAVGGVRAQIPIPGPCYAIEDFPDASKRPFLTQFLKDALLLADKSAQLIAEGRLAELYAANRTGFARDIRYATQEAFLKDYADREQREGKLLSYKFRGSGLIMWTDGPPADAMESWVTYAIKTTMHKKAAYLHIDTKQGEKGQVLFLIYLEHLPPHSPDNLTYGLRGGRVCEER